MLKTVGIHVAIVVEKAFKYPAEPASDAVAEAGWSAIQTCREVYNHALTQLYRPAPDHDKPSYTTMQNRLPAWKRQWPEWSDVYSKCLQMAVRRIKHAESALESLANEGYDVGQLQWKKPHEFRSMTYNQSGFDVDSNTDRADHATVDFSKIGTFHLTYHRPLPEDCTITQIVLKREKTGEWSVSIVVDFDPAYPEKPPIEEIDPAKTIGIDLGICQYIHDSAGRAFDSLDEQRDRDRIDRRHRELSRKKYGSQNWHRARRQLAKAYDRLHNRRQDYREKLASQYTRQYDAVFLEALDVASLMQRDRNSRNVAGMSWRETITAFQRHGQKNGCHVLTVDPRDTTKQCSQCGVTTDKELWVREHNCPSCGFTADRDYNAALEIKRRGLTKLGVSFDDHHIGPGRAEYTSSERRSLS